MHDNRQIESIINSILKIEDCKLNPTKFIIFIIPSSTEFNTPEIYLNVVALKSDLEFDEIHYIMHETRKAVGNIIFACDYKILAKEEVIHHLENLLV